MNKIVRLTEDNLKKLIKETILDELDYHTEQNTNGVKESLHKMLVTEGRTSDLYNEISNALAIARKNGNTPETINVLAQTEKNIKDYYDAIRGGDFMYGQKDKELLELSAQLCQLLWAYKHQSDRG